MKATLDPDRDLKGATPVTLAKALLRPRQKAKSRASDQSSVEKVATDKLDKSVPQVTKRP